MRRTFLPQIVLLAVHFGCVEQPAPPQPERDAPTATAAADLPAVLQIEGRGRTIEVLSGPDGLLYRVRAADGRVLVPPVDLRQLRTEHPDIYRQINTTYAGFGDLRTRR